MSGIVPEMTRIVVGAIKSCKKIHPNGLDGRSLVKRIVGNLKETFARLLFDRYLIDWLCKNRLDLSEINGELRIELFKLIKTMENNNELE